MVKNEAVSKYSMKFLGVMVNFMYQFDWAIGYHDIWLKNYPGCVCEGVFEKRLTLECVD